MTIKIRERTEMPFAAPVRSLDPDRVCLFYQRVPVAWRWSFLRATTNMSYRSGRVIKLLTWVGKHRVGGCISHSRRGIPERKQDQPQPSR